LHLLSILDLKKERIEEILDLAIEMKGGKRESFSRIRTSL
jgi:hypothetical protein